MQIEFISASFEQVPGKAGKTGYGKATVSYKAGGQARTQSVMSFSNPAVYSYLEGCQTGDLLEVVVTKNAAGYNQWASIDKSENTEAQVSTSPTKETPSKLTTTTYAARDFEGKEERAQRQALIVRQSSLSNAINMLTVGSEVSPPVDSVFSLADSLVAYVYNVGAGVPPNLSGSDDQ